MLRCALGVANFANFGTPKAMRPGLRTASLARLRQTKAKGAGDGETLLAFVTRHAAVKPQVLRRELAGLADAAAATSRDAVAEELRALTAERHGADAERAALEADESPLADVAAERVRRCVEAVDNDLERLETALEDLDEDVADCLASYGEDGKTADFQAWIGDLLQFVDAYGAEFREIEDAALRTRRRVELEAKKRLRKAALENLADRDLVSRAPVARDSMAGADFTNFLMNVRSGSVLDANVAGDASDDDWSDDDNANAATPTSARTPAPGRRSLRRDSPAA